MKTYDLTSAQGVIQYVMKLSKGKSHVMNVPTSMFVSDQLDFDILRKAIEIEIERNDSLRLRMFMDNKVVKQHFLEKDENPPIEVLDFTGKTLEEQEAQLNKLSRKGFKYLKERLYRFYLVKCWNGYTGVFANIHHLILDSYGIMVMYKDLFDVYHAIKENKEMPKPLHPYESLLQKELEYPGSEQADKDEQFYIEELSKSEAIYTFVTGTKWLDKRRKKEPNARGVRPTLSGTLIRNKCTHEICHISKEDTEKYMDFCKETGITFQCLFTMGLRTYLSIKNRREKDIIISGTVARRGTLAEKRSGGTRIHFFPLRSILEEETTALEGAVNIKETQNRFFKHANYPSPKYLDLIGSLHNDKGAGYSGVSLTYQPVAMEFEESEDIDTRWYGCGIAVQRLYITIMHNMSKAGGLDVYYEYQNYFVERDNILECQRIISLVMDETVNNPNITIGQLLDLCQENLDSKTKNNN